MGTKKGILQSKRPISLGTISTLKARDYAIYLDYAILGQLILGNNCPDLENYKLEENEVMLYVPLHNTENGYFRGTKKWLADIMVWGDSDKMFFSYGFDEESSKIMYSSFKHPLPNIFQGNAFKKHMQIHRSHFSSCPPLHITKKKLTYFLTIFIFIQLIALMKI